MRARGIIPQPGDRIIAPAAAGEERDRPIGSAPTRRIGQRRAVDAQRLGGLVEEYGIGQQHTTVGVQQAQAVLARRLEGQQLIVAHHHRRGAVQAGPLVGIGGRAAGSRRRQIPVAAALAGHRLDRDGLGQRQWGRGLTDVEQIGRAHAARRVFYQHPVTTRREEIQLTARHDGITVGEEPPVGVRRGTPAGKNRNLARCPAEAEDRCHFRSYLQRIGEGDGGGCSDRHAAHRIGYRQSVIAAFHHRAEDRIGGPVGGRLPHAPVVLERSRAPVNHRPQGIAIQTGRQRIRRSQYGGLQAKNRIWNLDRAHRIHAAAPVRHGHFVLAGLELGAHATGVAVAPEILVRGTAVERQ